MANETTYARETSSAKETKQLAAVLAAYVRAGDVVVLSGDLGAGKTQFVQGVAAALGVDAPVTSPTFNILLTYTDGRIPLYHLDLYRLDEPFELEDIDYYALTDGGGDGVAFVEWGEKFPSELPCDYLELSMTVGEQGRRVVSARPRGSRAHELLRAWAKDSKAGLTRCAADASESTQTADAEGVRP